MPLNTSAVLISLGFPPGSPWLIEDLDTNFKNFAVASMSSQVSKQSTAIQTQTNVLKEQTNQLEEMQDYTLKLKAGTETALVMDSNGNVLETNPSIVSDLIGRPVSNPLSNFTSAEVDRLIDFTTDLTNSVEPVNLGNGPYVSVTVRIGQPATERSVAAPLKLWNTDPAGVTPNVLDPFVCYAFRAPNGTFSYRNLDGDRNNLSVISVASLPLPDKNLVYDAYRIDTGTATSPVIETFVPQNTSVAFPTTQTNKTLFRNVFTGELRLVGPSQPNIPILRAQGFVIPSSQSDIDFWFGQAAATRLRAANTQFAADEVKIPAPDTFQWKYNNFEQGGFAPFPPQKGSLTDTTLAIGTLIEDSSTSSLDTPRLYLITGRVGSVNKFTEVVKVGSEFTMKLSSDSLVSVRGQYTERISRLTQRTAEQQAFLNSLVQKFNNFNDIATNLLKVLSDGESRLANFI